MIGYKKLKIVKENGDRKYVIAKLKILGNVVQSPGHFKKRTSRAKVLEIMKTKRGYVYYSRKLDRYVVVERKLGKKMTMKECRDVNFSRSLHSSSFKYWPGKIVNPTEKFNDNKTEDCGSGIHYFDDLERAMAY